MFALLLATLWPLASARAGKPIRWVKGEFYFRMGNRQAFLLGRNPTGIKVEQFAPFLEWAGESGERIIRVHLTTGLPPAAGPGRIDEAWAKQWEEVFDLAEKRGLHVLPVFGVWADWNDGSRGEPWHAWKKNPYSAVLGGPAKTPVDLLGDTPCRKLWLEWVAALVKQWAARNNILGWEVFSELDLVTGATEGAGLDFARQAARVVRAADPAGRPVMASLSGTVEWPRLFADEAMDFIPIHPYADGVSGGRLDELILSCVRARLKRYGKPVFLGECGLASAPPAGTLTTAPRADVGLRQAIWAAVVSGAMNGRMLWWEDGYDRYHRIDLRTKYKGASAAAARFVREVDFADFRPVEAEVSEGLFGAAIGNKRMVLGWFRDAACVPPDWPVRRLEGQSVTLTLPAGGPDNRKVLHDAEWTVAFHDTTTGEAGSKQTLRAADGRLRVPLPPLEGSVALRASLAGQ